MRSKIINEKYGNTYQYTILRDGYVNGMIAKNSKGYTLGISGSFCIKVMENILNTDDVIIGYKYLKHQVIDGQLDSKICESTIEKEKNYYEQLKSGFC